MKIICLTEILLVVTYQLLQHAQFDQLTQQDLEPMSLNVSSWEYAQVIAVWCDSLLPLIVSVIHGEQKLVCEESRVNVSSWV